LIVDLNLRLSSRLQWWPLVAHLVAQLVMGVSELIVGFSEKSAIGWALDGVQAQSPGASTPKLRDGLADAIAAKKPERHAHPDKDKGR
jgi:hypothetical protein